MHLCGEAVRGVKVKRTKHCSVFQSFPQFSSSVDIQFSFMDYVNVYITVCEYMLQPIHASTMWIVSGFMKSI